MTTVVLTSKTGRKHRIMLTPCKHCGKQIRYHTGREPRCNRCARQIMKGENHPCWKGGKYVRGDRYVMLKMRDHPLANKNGYVYEHRLVVSKKLGRLLNRGEHVHHLDGNPSNNSPDNLVVCQTSKEHIEKFHHKRGNCPQCGKYKEDFKKGVCACCYNSNFQKARRRKIRPVPWGPKVK